MVDLFKYSHNGTLLSLWVFPYVEDLAQIESKFQEDIISKATEDLQNTKLDFTPKQIEVIDLFEDSSYFAVRFSGEICSFFAKWEDVTYTVGVYPAKGATTKDFRYLDIIQKLEKSRIEDIKAVNRRHKWDILSELRAKEGEDFIISYPEKIYIGSYFYRGPVGINPGESEYPGKEYRCVAFVKKTQRWLDGSYKGTALIAYYLDDDGYLQKAEEDYRHSIGAGSIVRER